MKYGIYYAYWEKEWDAGFSKYMKYIKAIAELGFDVCEFSCAPIPGFSDAQLGELKACAKYYGVALTANYGPDASQNIASGDPAVVKNAKAFYSDLFKRLYKLDIHLIGGGIYSYWPVDYAKPIDKAGDRERSVAGIRELSYGAEDCGVTMCLEVINRFEGYLLNTAAEGAAFVDEVGRANVKLLLDTFHMNIEEDSIKGAIRAAGGRLGHLHVGECNRRVPGKGRMPWEEIGSALRGVGYNGAAVMEPFVMQGGRVGSDIKVWRELEKDTSEESLSRDARESLGFLKGVFKG